MRPRNGRSIKSFIEHISTLSVLCSDPPRNFRVGSGGGRYEVQLILGEKALQIFFLLCFIKIEYKYILIRYAESLG